MNPLIEQQAKKFKKEFGIEDDANLLLKIMLGELILKVMKDTISNPDINVKGCKDVDDNTIGIWKSTQ